MLKIGLISGSLFAGLSIVFGAFGAHALKNQLTEYSLSVYDKAVLYQMFHALGILIVNILGCFLLGLFYNLMDSSLEKIITPFLFIGFLGAFTTFSAFSKESLDLMVEGQFLSASLYISISIFSCLGATWLGIYLTKA